MTIYEEARQASLKLLEEFNANSEVCDALELPIPNSGDQINYENWLEGSVQFIKDHIEILKEW